MEEKHEFVNCFNADYRAVEMPEWPASTDREYLFHPLGERAADGLLVRVAYDGERWHGVFKFGVMHFSGLFNVLNDLGDLVSPSKKRIADSIVYADWARR